MAYRILMNLLVLATQAIANVVKSSFGPSGLDKMMVDDIGVIAATHNFF
jgi:T-complex protein 1 subunit alpha